MFQLTANPFVIVGLSFALGLVMTYLVRSFALRYDFVAKPKSDRWHKRQTAMLGGVAIFIATAASYFLFVPLTNDSLVVMGGAAFLFLVGLVDDIYSIRPYQKLIGQLIGAGFIV